MLGITKGDVTTDSFGETLPGEDAESAGHMFQHPSSLLIDCCEGWDAGQLDSLRNCLDCDLLEGLVIIRLELSDLLRAYYRDSCHCRCTSKYPSD